MDLTEPHGAILRPRDAARAFTVARHAPSPALAPLIQHFWFARWSIPEGQTFVQYLLPMPGVNFTIEPDADTLTGPVSKRGEKHLSGTGRVFGALFEPGGFQPFYRRSMHELVDRQMSVTAVFPGSVPDLRAALWATGDVAQQVALMEAFLLAVAPVVGPEVARVKRVVSRAREDRSLLTAEALAAASSLSLRGLQRLLRRHLGLGPKALLGRFRLQEAAHRLATEPEVDHIELALSLGYYDQAHFVRDFAAVIGEPPGRYAAQCSARRGPHLDGEVWKMTVDGVELARR